VPIVLGAIGDDEAALRDALARCDGLILSGGTSKSAGDLTYRVVARLGEPRIIAHGVALKPGKPRCLAVVDGKPVVLLPGFPTSAMFTIHDFVAPVIRAMSGLAARLDASVEATTPFPILSELGRTEFVMAALTQREDGLKAFPLGKGSGAVSCFAHADGFLRIDALADHLEAGARTQVTLFDPELCVPDLVIMGSHCIGLEIIIDALAEAGKAPGATMCSSSGCGAA